MRRLLVILIALALVLSGSAAAQNTETEEQQPGFVLTEELLAALLEWICNTNPDALPEGACTVEPEPDPEEPATTTVPADDRSPEETLAYWQQPGQTASVDTQYACLIGSYHHTCTTWVNGEGHQVTCTTPGCDPTK